MGEEEEKRGQNRWDELFNSGAPPEYIAAVINDFYRSFAERLDLEISRINAPGANDKDKIANIKEYVTGIEKRFAEQLKKFPPVE